MRRSALLVSAIALLTVPPGIAAQTIRGEIIDGSSLQPLEGSVVVVLDAEGAAVQTAITSAEGRFVARLNDAGVYSLRVDRIGYESTASEPIEVGAGEDVFRRIEVAVVPVALDEIEVSSGRVCVVRPGPEALATARVWEQARTALTATATTQRQRLLRFDSETWVRELDSRSMRIRSEERSTRRGTPVIPFGSRDARDLAENGYIQTIENGRYYDFFAPTAEVILSDSFLDTHCFRLEAGEDENEGLIGLRFEPVQRRDVPDITGTLWIDRAASALRYVEMRFVTRDPDVPTDGALARVEFEALPGGRWIVDRWLIRMPQLVEQRLPGGFGGVSRVRRSVGSFIENGGEVTRVADARGNPSLSAARYVVDGTVYDSLRGRPLAAARVALQGTSHEITTDSDGRFTFAGVPPGRYTLRVEHARLDSLPIAARPRGEVTVAAGVPDTVELAVPTQYTVVESTCPGLWNAVVESVLPSTPHRVAGDALITGLVVDGTGQPIASAVVHVNWDEYSIAADRLFVRSVMPTTTTDGDGRFTICGVPSDKPLSVWATVGESTGEVVETRANGRFAFVAPVVKR